MMPPIIKHIAKIFFLFVLAIGFQIAGAQQADAATRTWDAGGGVDTNWSTCANWSLDTCPGTGDIATFDAGSGASTIDAGFTTGVTTFNMNAGYTGIITQARSFTVTGATTIASGTFNGSTDNLTTAAFTVSGGTFTGGNQIVSHSGGLTISAGTYTASSNKTTFGGGFTHTVGGVFAHNNGSVSFTGGATTTNVTVTENFYSVEINKNNATLMTISSGDTLIVNNTLTLTNGGFTTGTLNAKNTISLDVAWDGGGTGTLLIDGVNTQTLSLNGGQAALAATITLNNTNFTFNGAGAGALNFGIVNLQAGAIDSTGFDTSISGAYVQSGGAFTGGSGTVTQTGAFTLSAGTYTASSGTTTFVAAYTHTAGGTFTHNNGSVAFTGSATTTNANPAENFYNLELNKNNATLMTITSGRTLIVNNTLTLTNGGFTTGTVNAKNTISLNTGWDGGGTGILLIDGVNTQTLSLNGAQAALAATITINNANFTFNGTGVGTLNFAVVNLQAGAIDSTGFSMTTTGAFTQSGGTFTAGAGTIAFNSAVAISAGTFNANSSTLNFLTTFILSGTGSFNGGTATVTHTSTFTISGGTYTATSGTTTFVAAYTHNAGGTFTHNNGTAIFTGGGVTIAVGTETFYKLTINKTTTTILTFSVNSTVVVTNLLSLVDGLFNTSGTGAMQAEGDVTVSSTWDGGGTGSLKFAGGIDQIFTLTGAEALVDQAITINKSAGTVNLASGLTMNAGGQTFTQTLGDFNTNGYAFSVSGAYLLTAGTFTSGASTLAFNGTFTINGGTFNATSGTTTFGAAFTQSGVATFNHNNGSVIFGYTSTTVYTSASTLIFNNVQINSTNAGQLTINGAGLMQVDGTLTLTNGFFVTGTINAKGNVSVGAGWDASTAGTLLIDGTNAATMTMNAGAMEPAFTTTINNANYNVVGGGTGTLTFDTLNLQAGTINTSGFTVVHTSTTTISGGTYSQGSGAKTFSFFVLSSGTYNGNTSTPTFSGTFTLSGGTFNASSGTTSINSTFTQSNTPTFNHNNGSVIFGYTSNVIYTSASTLTFNNVEINSTNAAQFQINGAGLLQVDGTLTLTNGFFVTGTINAKSNISVGAGWDATTSGTLLIDGTNASTMTMAAGAKEPAFITTINNANYNVVGGGTGTLTFDSLNLQAGTINTSGFDVVHTAATTISGGTYTQGSGTKTFSTFTLSSGTYNGDNSTSTFGAVTLSGGTFNASSVTTSFNGSLTQSNTPTFNHNNGSVIFGYTSNVIYTSASTLIYNNVEINSTNAAQFQISGVGLIQVDGTLTLTNGFVVIGTINAKGNVSVGAGWDASTSGTLLIDGTNASTMTMNAGAKEPAYVTTINNANYNVVGGGTGTLTFDILNLQAGTINTSGFDVVHVATTTISGGAYTQGSGTKTFSTFNQSNGTYNGNTSTPTFAAVTISGGTFNAGSGTVTFSSSFAQSLGSFDGQTATVVHTGAFTLSGGTYLATPNTTSFATHFTHTAGGTFTANGGLVTAIGGSVTANFDMDGSELFYDFEVNKTHSVAIAPASGDTLYIAHTLTLSNGRITGGTATDVQGNVFLGTAWDGGSTPLKFSGSNVQTLNIAVGAESVFAGDIIVNKSGGEVDLATSNLTFGSSFQDLLIQSGTFDLSGFNLNTNVAAGLTTISSGGNLQLQGSETITTPLAGGPTFNAGSKMTYDGVAGPYVMKDYTYKSITIAGGSSSVFLLPANETVAENLTITSGIVSQNGYTLTVTGTFSNEGTLRRNQAETFTGTMDVNSGTVEYVGNNDGASDTVTIADFGGGGTDYFNLKINDINATKDNFSIGSELTVAGTIEVTSGTLTQSGSNAITTTGAMTTNGGTFTGGSGTMTIGGLFTISSGAFTATSGTMNLNNSFVLSSGTFTHNSGVVVFSANANHNITGSIAWNSLTLQDTNDNATDVTITIQTGTTQTINGTLTLDGLDDSDRLNIASSTPGAASTFDFQGSSNFSGDYLDIIDNNVTDNSSGINVPINPANSVERGDTLNWISLTPAGITVTESSASTDVAEGGVTDSYTIVLNTQPSADVAVNFTFGSQLSLSSTGFTFTSLNWATPQTLTVTAVDDSVMEGSHNATVSHTVSSADGGYNALVLSDITVHITDNDTAGFTVSAISGTVSESGTTATYTVSLTSQPTADVSFDISSNDTSEGTISGTSLTFTSINWNTPQTVTVTGVNDFIVDGTVAFSIVNATATSADSNYNTLNPNDVSVSTTDNDVAGFTVSAISGSVAETGTTANYTINLTSQPTADVNIGVSSSNTAEGTVSASSLTFTSANWNTPQTITVTGVDDLLVDGTVVFSIVNAAATSADSAYNNLNPNDVSVSCTDNDSAGITVTQSSGNTAVSESGITDSYTLVLTSQPTNDVIITFTGNAQLSLSGTTITFTSLNWNTPQTLTVSAVDDYVFEGPHSADISHSVNSVDSIYNGYLISNISVAITDNDTAGFTLTAVSGNVSESGTTATYTVALTSQPTADVSFNVVSSDTGIGTVSGTSLTFTSATWSFPQTLTITGVNNFIIDGTVALTIANDVATSADTAYNNLNPADVSLSRTDDDVAGITLTESTGTAVTEGSTTDSITFVLSSQPSADVTISLTGDSQISLSASSLIFTSGNWNSIQTLTITAVDDSTVENQAIVSLSSAVTSVDLNYNAFVISPVSITVTDNDTTVVVVVTTTTSSGGGGGSTYHHTSHNPSPTTTTTSTLGFTTPTNWSSGYYKNLIQEKYIVEMALSQTSFFDVLSSLFSAPNSGMHRGEAIQFLVVLSQFNISTVTIDTSRPTFSDVKSTASRAAYIEFAAQAGLINGYADGTFKPNRVVNRAEALKICMKFFAKEVPNLYGKALLDNYKLTINPFIDVDLNQWYAPYVITAYHYGVVKGYNDGSFQPGKQVSNAEFLKISSLSKNIEAVEQI